VNGRAGIVIKNTFLSNGGAAAVRRKLLEECNVHTILDLPSGVFTGAGVKTVVIFFTKGELTHKIWYYQLNLPRTLGKTNPLSEADLEEFIRLQKTQTESENSWLLDVSALGEDCDLSVKNPNKPEIIDDRTPSQILDTIASLNADSAELINQIRELL
jgi:type I restriction enzyme M protein